MAYVEVWKSGILVTRRRIDERKARKGCRVRLGSAGEVRVAAGDSQTLGKYEVRMFEGDPPAAEQQVQETASRLPDDGRGAPGGRPGRRPDIEGYKIIEPLGEGGMGIVWRAEQLSTRRQVALKLLVSHRIDSPKAQARFQREVELTARLDHPNIARIYDSGLHRGMYYYAMELIDGVPLDQYVKSKALSQNQILALMRTVCQAVLYAHLRGVIHRDLKPSNIAVGPDGRPHVLDFGLAKALLEEEEALTISIEGQIAGTPAYMAPEQAAGRQSQTDTRTDVFSLGVILCQLLTGQSPHDLSGTLFDVLERIIHGKMKRPRELCKTIDQELEALLLKALAHDPEDRYASAGALARDIGNYLDGEPLDAQVPTVLYFLRKKALKYRVQVGAAAAVLVIVFGGLLAAYTKIVTERGRRKAAEEEIRLQAHKGELAASKLKWTELELKVLGKNEAEARAALRVLRDEYLAGQQNIVELEQKVGRREAPVPTKRIDLKQGRALSPTAVVRQPALPRGVQSWTLETLGHRGGVIKLALSPNGRLLASGSVDGTIRLWDSDSGRLVRILVGSPGAVTGLDWSSDGKTIISISQDTDNLIRLWDAESGTIQKSFPLGETSIRCVACSPDDRFVASCPHEPADVTIWDVATERPLQTLKGHTARINAMAWSPDGGRLATGGADRTVKLWQPMTGRLVRSFEESPDRIVSLAWSPDRRTIAISGAANNPVDSTTIRLWDTVSGKVVSSLEMDVEKGYANTRDLAWTPDGETIACTTDDKIRILDVKSGRLRPLSPGMAGSLAWSADGRTLAFGNFDGEIRFWDSQSGRLVRSRMSSSAGPVHSVSFSPDGRFLAAAGKLGTVCLWDAHRWEPLSALQAYGIECTSFGGSVLAWSPGSDALAIGHDLQNAIVIIEPQSGAVLDVIEENQQPVRSIAFSPDGKLLATAHVDGTVRLWNAESGSGENIIRLDAHTTEKGYITIAWSPDGNSLLSTGESGIIKIWQSKTGEHVRSLEGHSARVSSMAWSSDGQTLASGSNDGTIRLWDVASGRTTRVLRDTSATSGDGPSMFIAIAWSPDGTRLASTNAEAYVQIWDPDSGKLLQSVAARLGTSTSLAWSPDGQFLVCSGYDGTAGVWDARNNCQPYAVLLPLWGPGAPGVAVNPHGDYRGPPGVAEHLVYVAQTERGQELLSPRQFANRYGWVNEPWQVGLHAPGSEKVERVYVNADAQGPHDGNSWDTAFNDLQDALNPAATDTEIWVAAGVYKPDRDTGVREASFRLRNGVSLYGGFSGTETSRYQRDPNKYDTILTGDLKGDDGPDFANNDENSYHVVTADEPVKSATLDSFTVTGGNANDPAKDGHNNGGGMWNDRGHCALINCTFFGNRSDLAGGGISSWGSLAITNCTFSDNLARDRGGGLYCGGSDTSVLTGCIFTGNKAHDHGGGVDHRGQAGAIFISCRFVANSAPEAGGLHTQGSFYTQPTLINCAFCGNLASNVAGGMTNRGSSPTLINCIFAGNSAGAYAGAIHNLQNACPVLTNCTFVANAVRGRAGGIDNSDDCQPVLTNCILWGNSDQRQYFETSQISGPALINRCCIQGWSGKLGGVRNFGDDPLFVDPDGPDDKFGTEDDDLRLGPNSPCINAGDNSALPADSSDLDGDGDAQEPVPFDIEGKARVLGGTVDIGAYEGG